MSILMIKEAIASVALSHEAGHQCDVCKAAQGDGDALERVLIQMANTMDKWTDAAGTLWEIHTFDRCLGTPCPFHQPSQHHMVEWPLMLNTNKGLLAERVCEHEALHPDPDSLAYHVSQTGNAELGEHDCCENDCCLPPVPMLSAL